MHSRDSRTFLTVYLNVNLHAKCGEQKTQWNKSETDKHVLNSIILDCRTWSNRHYWFYGPNQVADFGFVHIASTIYWIVIYHKLINTIESFTKTTNTRRLRQRTSCWWWKLLNLYQIYVHWWVVIECKKEHIANEKSDKLGVKMRRPLAIGNYIVCLNHCSASINRIEKCNV